MMTAGEPSPSAAEAALHAWLSLEPHQVTQASEPAISRDDVRQISGGGEGGGATVAETGPYSLLYPEADQGKGVKNLTENSVHRMLGLVYREATAGYFSDLRSVNRSEDATHSGEREGSSNQSVSAYNFTSSKDLSSLLSEDAMDNATSSDGDGARSHIIGVLMGSASPTIDQDESTASKNSSSMIKEALSFTLEAGEETLGSPQDQGLQRLMGGSDWPYLSALTHNLSYHHPSVSANLANVTHGREPLFADYPPHLLDFAVFCCVLFIVLGVPGNLITIIALVKCKKVHNATAVFIINLTLSDLMFGVFNLPLAASLFGHRAWVHTGFLCLLFPILRYGLVAVSVFTVLAITINRYVMIAHPRLYHRLYTRTWLAIMVVATWIGAFGALVPTLLEFWGTFGLDPAIGSCTILPDRDGNSPKEFLFVFAFVLPCVAICVCYARIFCIVHRADKKSHSHSQHFLKVNGKRHKNVASPCTADPPTLQTLHATPLHDRLQLETLVKLSTSSNSVKVEIVEPQEESQKNEESSLDGNGRGGCGSKEGTRTPSPETTPAGMTTDASSLLKTEANGFSGHSSNEGVGASSAACSPIRISPPTAPESPASVKSDRKISTNIERRPSTISGRGGTFSHLRGTFRRTRAGSFIARQPTLSAKDRRLLKMILVIFLSFVACYLPITLVKTFSKDDNPVLNILGLLLIYLTTCINPIIYVVMSSEYRQAYVSLLTCKRDHDPANRSVTKIS
ncbi:D(2) dopamine receptor [Procambarus clarkii]|uniref:D(2) dopamine receptor n=1 Tax=Procambarus clarkii TaxID=6728 RepID=UPI001E6734A2|nr:tyramine/octopamine receptor-like [Procambarus clarkii]